VFAPIGFRCPNSSHSSTAGRRARLSRAFEQSHGDWSNLFADPAIKKSRVIQYARPLDFPMHRKCPVEHYVTRVRMYAGSRQIYSRSRGEPAIDRNGPSQGRLWERERERERKRKRRGREREARPRQNTPSLFLQRAKGQKTRREALSRLLTASSAKARCTCCAYRLLYVGIFPCFKFSRSRPASRHVYTRAACVSSLI